MCLKQQFAIAAAPTTAFFDVLVQICTTDNYRAESYRRLANRLENYSHLLTIGETVTLYAAHGC